MQSSVIRTVRCLSIGVLAFASLLTASASSQERPPVALRGSDGHWSVAGNAEARRHRGRDAVLIGGGGVVTWVDGPFSSGTIEFDMAPDESTQYLGVTFRTAEGGDADNVYFRPERSGTPNAVQYHVRLRSAQTWQLYPEFQGWADIAPNQWTHVRIEVDGPRAEVFVGGRDEPALVVPRLRSGNASGSLAFWASDGTGLLRTAAISNMEVRPRDVSPAVTEPTRPESTLGFLPEWQVAGPLQAPNEGPVLTLPPTDVWDLVVSEEDGLVNLTRKMGTPPRGQRWTALARTLIDVDAPRTVALDIAYSDDATVFLNGAPLFSGANGSDSRYPGYAGRISLGVETVYLPLRSGQNELVLAVSERPWDGWGFKARLHAINSDGDVSAPAF